jgi:LEA14-like dessication related protein
LTNTNDGEVKQGKIANGETEYVFICMVANENAAFTPVSAMKYNQPMAGYMNKANLSSFWKAVFHKDCTEFIH